jgi:hypothetical protein
MKYRYACASHIAGRITSTSQIQLLAISRVRPNNQTAAAYTHLPYVPCCLYKVEGTHRKGRWGEKERSATGCSPILRARKNTPKRCQPAAAATKPRRPKKEGGSAARLRCSRMEVEERKSKGCLC